jgi:hypothetical protein
MCLSWQLEPQYSFTHNTVLLLDIAFIDRADIKLAIGPPGLRARYEIVSSCMQELMRTGLINPPVIPPSQPNVSHRRLTLGTYEYLARFLKLQNSWVVEIESIWLPDFESTIVHPVWKMWGMFVLWSCLTLVLGLIDFDVGNKRQSLKKTPLSGACYLCAGNQIDSVHLLVSTSNPPNYRLQYVQ